MRSKTAKLLAVNLALFCIFFESGSQLFFYVRSKSEPFLRTDVMKEVDRYLGFVNHSRGQDTYFTLSKKLNKPGNIEKPSLFAYSSYCDTHVNGQTCDALVLQGDSWGERLENSAADLFVGMAGNNHLKFVAAGTGSFSPSNMSAQLDYLIQDQVLPRIVIAYIDQSDLGDEFCRYRDYTRITYSNRQNEGLATRPILRVLPYANGGEMVFEYTPITKLFRVPIASVRVLAEGAYRVKRKYDKIVHGKSYKSICSWRDISRQLKTSNRESIEYFSTILQLYINSVLGTGHVKRLYFVTHPHRGNLDGSYKVNVSALVDKAISKSSHKSKIFHVNFSNLIESKEEAPQPFDIFEKGDLASHLTDSAYRTMAKKITESIGDDLANHRYAIEK